MDYDQYTTPENTPRYQTMGDILSRIDCQNVLAKQELEAKEKALAKLNEEEKKILGLK